ncbi:MAG: AAA family ATPase [Bacillota bacterium]
MTFNIALAGKGGTGKTTLAALIIRQLIKHGKKPVLAVDADANANLNEALGIEVEDTIAELVARVNNSREPLPSGMTKDQYVALKVHESLAESDNVDLMVMGGPEGAGCYCFVNNLVKNFVHKLSDNYPYMVMDNEAGLEHLSRRTTQNIDILFVTSDASVRGIRSAGRVKRLVDNLALDVKKMYLVVTRVNEGSIDTLHDEILKTGLELIAAIPRDDQVFNYDLQGKPLADLPDDNPVVATVDELLHKASVL